MRKMWKMWKMRKMHSAMMSTPSHFETVKRTCKTGMGANANVNSMSVTMLPSAPLYFFSFDVLIMKHEKMPVASTIRSGGKASAR